MRKPNFIGGKLCALNTGGATGSRCNWQRVSAVRQSVEFKNDEAQVCARSLSFRHSLFGFVIFRPPVAAQWRIRLAKAIAPRLRLQPPPLRRNAESCSSRVFPRCNPMAAQEKVLKQDAEPGWLQDLSTADDHRFRLTKI